MAEIKNRSTRLFNTVTEEFRRSLKDLPKKRVPGFGEEATRMSKAQDPLVQMLKDMDLRAEDFDI